MQKWRKERRGWTWKDFTDLGKGRGEGERRRQIPRKDFISHIVWAGNWFLFAKTIGEAQTMIDELTEAMASLALSWKPSSAAIIGSKGGGRKPGGTSDWENSGPEDELRVQIIENGEATQIPVPWVDELEVLGDWVESDGRNGVAVEKRQGKGDKIYFKYRNLLVGRRAKRENNTKDNLQVHVQAPQAATLHGAGTWRWEREMARSLHQWEREKLCN